MALSPIEDRYLSALTAVQFPDMPVEPEQPLEQAASMDGMQLAAGPSGTVSDAGGGMGEIKPIPRNAVVGGVADFVRGVRDMANQYEIKDFVPLLGGMGVGDLLLGKSPEEIENWAYGNSPITMPPSGTGGYVPVVKTGRKEGLADVVGLGLDAAPIGKAVTMGAKVAVKAAKPVMEMIGKSLTQKGAKLTPSIEVPSAGDITKPAFKKWFGDSKVTDNGGQPVVVYHARSGDFGEFDTAGRGKTKGTGAFFSSSADVASTYAVKGEENIVPVYLSMKKPVIIDANGANWSDIDMSAKISVPEIKVSDIEEQKLMAELTGSAVDESAMKTIPAAEMSLGDLKINNKVIDKKVNTDEIARWARKMGYDGVIIKNVIDSGPSGRYMPDEAMNPHNVYVAFEPTQIKSVFNKGTWNPDDPRMVQGAGAATAGTGTATMSDKEQK